eukprot:6195128-Pleurochrysis_carterae.AAC.1
MHGARKAVVKRSRPPILSQPPHAPIHVSKSGPVPCNIPLTARSQIARNGIQARCASLSAPGTFCEIFVSPALALSACIRLGRGKTARDGKRTWRQHAAQFKAQLALANSARQNGPPSLIALENGARYLACPQLRPTTHMPKAVP